MPDAAFDVVTFLQQLVAVPSCDPPGGELEVARLVQAQMDAFGIDAELDEFLPGRANVVGRVPGRGEKPPLVFSAHLDTTPVGEQPWSFPPFAGDLHGGRVRGRGGSDMKGALAAFVAAAAQLAARRTPLAGDLLLAFTAGESAAGIGARRLLEQGFQREIGAFLCGEPSSLDIIVAEKAVLWLSATARGELGHVSGAPGVNAIDRMIEFLTALKTFELNLPPHPLLSGPSLNVGTIRGGSAVNLTADLCQAQLDIRFGPGVDPQTVLARLRPLAPGGVMLEIMDFKPAVERDPDGEFVTVCADAVRELTGREPLRKGVSYYSDAALLLDGIAAPFAILGPGDLGMSGQTDETVSAVNVRLAAEIYRRVAESWLV